MSAIIPVLLSILGQIAPGANTVLIADIIQALVQIVPVLVQEYKDLAPIVAGIIDTLRGNTAITPEQLAALDVLDTQTDAAFDAAAVAAAAEDAKG